VLDGAMEVFLGDNDTRMPAKVFYGTPPSSTTADAEVVIKLSGEMNVIIHQGAQFVPVDIDMFDE